LAIVVLAMGVLAEKGFAQSTQTQKNEPVKNNETATLQNNNVSPNEKTQANTANDELLKASEKSRDAMNGIYKIESEKKQEKSEYLKREDKNNISLSRTSKTVNKLEPKHVK
ncbi:hypothetical protein GW829_14810, partial [bacterium]|nr:hypothetical protein [bacterium]